MGEDSGHLKDVSKLKEFTEEVYPLAGHRLLMLQDTAESSTTLPTSQPPPPSVTLEELEAMDQQLQKLIKDTKALQQAQTELDTREQEYEASTSPATRAKVEALQQKMSQMSIGTPPVETSRRTPTSSPFVPTRAPPRTGLH